MKKLMILSIMFMAVGCASNKIKQLDTEMEIKGTTSQGFVGLKDNQAIIQEKKSADDELRVQQWKNYQLENDLNHEYHMVEWCYSDLSDPRLGGNGDVAEAPDLKNLKNSVAIKEELGLEGEKLVVVKTYSFEEQLKVERQYEQSMASMIKEIKKTRSSCERKMGAARVKAGLPSKRIQGKITITPDGRVGEVIKEHENNLDDAFRIAEPKVEAAPSERVPATAETSAQGE